MRRIRILLSSAALVAVMTGCTDVTSDAILTNGMYADMWAVATGNGTTQVTASLRVGGATSTTYVELVGDDALTATLDGEENVMTHQQLLAVHSYTTDFQVDAAGSEFHVALSRSADAGAPDSSMTLPEPFELDALPTNFSRAEDFTITWSPSGEADGMQVSVIGGCVFDVDAEIDGDPGTFTFEAGDIEKAGEELEDSCEVTVTLQRRRDGTPDAAFGEGGWVRGLQRRTEETTSDP